MQQPGTTSWTLIDSAARGDAGTREEFARRYMPAVQAYFAARWTDPSDSADVEDAAQEVFIDCIRTDGALCRAQPGGGGGFRAFLHGVARNVAMRFERKRARRKDRPAPNGLDLDALSGRERSLTRVFDRAWAQSIMREAVERLERSVGDDSDARRRFELLRLRFHDGMPIRTIAQTWGVEPRALHKSYARARLEFKRCLIEVVGFHHPGTTAEIQAECQALLALLE